MLRLRFLERVADVPREAWDAIALPSESPFVEWTWLDCLESSGCVGEGTGWLPRHFALYRGSDLVAVAPAYVKDNSEGEFVFDWSWADFAARIHVDYYPKLVLGVPFTPATGDRALVAPGENKDEIIAALAEAARGVCEQTGISSAHVLFPREAEAAAWERAGFASRLGVQYHWVNDGFSSMDDFLGRFNSKKRNQLKREIAQPERAGMTIESHRPSDLGAEGIRAMHEFYTSTVDQFRWGRRYLNEAFFAMTAERFSDRLDWVFAKKDGRLVAGAFNAKKDDRLYGRYWGCSPEVAREPFLHFNVCYYHSIRACIAAGIRVFEPGAGGEHKKARGFLPTITHSAHWIGAPRFRHVIETHLIGERDAVRAHVAEERATSGFKTA